MHRPHPAGCMAAACHSPGNLYVDCVEDSCTRTLNCVHCLALMHGQLPPSLGISSCSHQLV